MFRYLAIFVVIFFTQANYASNVYTEMAGSISNMIDYNGDEKSNTKIYIECNSSLMSVSSAIITTTLNYAPGRKRCEFDILNQVDFNTPFQLSWYFKANSNYVNFSHSHILFQLHATPDLTEGENWRCPLLSLESINGTLRMYSHWDEKHISTLNDGTCASSENSIESRTLFTDFDYNANTWYHVTLKFYPTYDDSNSGYVKLYINDSLLGNAYGFTAFNDNSPPYIKFGIYKYTPWEDTSTVIKVLYKNISYQEL